MHVRLTRHWAGFKPQRVFCGMPDGVAHALIRRHLAEPVSDQTAETQAVSFRGTGPQDAETAPGRRGSKRRTERVRG